MRVIGPTNTLEIDNHVSRSLAVQGEDPAQRVAHAAVGIAIAQLQAAGWDDLAGELLHVRNETARRLAGVSR